MRHREVRTAVLVGGALLAASLSWGAEPIGKPEELVAKHLEAIGAPAARTAVKSRAVTGDVEFRVLSGAHGGNLGGSSTLLTDGRKLLLFIKFMNNEYRGERFIFDGDRVEIRGATAQNRRSALGEFLRTQDAVVREGLLGGVLSTGWPLLNLEERKAKLSLDGLKMVDGQKLIELQYRPKKSSDLSIHLYFDPETYRHVRSSYVLTIHPSMVTGDRGATESANASQTESHFRLDEKFSDFKKVDGLTLPTRYVLQYSDDRQAETPFETPFPVGAVTSQSGGGSAVSQWDNTEKEIQHNVSPDPRNFTVK